MEIHNYTRSHQIDSKPATEIKRPYHKNLFINSNEAKKILLKKKYERKLSKMFLHLAYQELDAD